MNKLFSDNISLDRDNHIYKLKSNPNIEFISVTTFISQFFEKFEAEKIAQRLVTYSPKYMDMTVSSILKMWGDSAIHGTKVHEEIENCLLNKIEATELKAMQGLSWLNKFKLQSDFLLYPEVMIYSEELKLSGTIDLLLFNKDTQEYIIMDWKTSKSISTKAFNKKTGILPQSMNIEDSKFNQYALQLSMYRYLIEKYYGLNVSEQMIIHLQDDSCTAIHAGYMKNNVMDFISII